MPGCVTIVLWVNACTGAFVVYYLYLAIAGGFLVVPFPRGYLLLCRASLSCIVGHWTLLHTWSLLLKVTRFAHRS